MEAWIDRVGRTRLCGSDWRTGWRRGSEAWIGGLGLGSAWDFDKVGQQWASDVKAGGSETER